MGSQQILLIVVIVLITGLAVVTGIQMFNNQSISQNRSNCILDLNSFHTQIEYFYKMPVIQGGASNSEANATLDRLKAWARLDDNSQIDNDNATYTFSIDGHFIKVSTVSKPHPGIVKPELSYDMTSGTATITTN